MDAFDGAAGGVIHVAEGSIPFKGNGCATGYAGFAGHTLGSTVAGEMLGKNATIVVLLLVLWRIDGEAFGSVGHLFIGDSLRGNLFEGVNP